MTPQRLLIAAGILGFTGVGLGAFGAHALKATLEAGNHLETWKTAVFYQLVHAVALLALANWPTSAARKIGWCWIAGVLLFSGSLYGLALGGPKILGPVTPLGGVAFLAGWAWVIVSAWKRPVA
jgi:uncharacterized membrane protein YgdD (TMEM256/DUF423 family)